MRGSAQGQSSSACTQAPVCNTGLRSSSVAPYGRKAERKLSGSGGETEGFGERPRKGARNTPKVYYVM